MAGNSELFGRTFDQQVQIAGKEIANRAIEPNRLLAGEIVFEPMGNGVRVTARDETHRVLWGFVASKGTLDQIHCLVAVYPTFQNLIREDLEKRGLPVPPQADFAAEAAQALNKLESAVKWLRDSLQGGKESTVSAEKARLVGQIASDAEKQISLAAASVKGMRSRAE